MRPRRLEMEGFTAFRRRTVIDLSEAELFALTGPTGAGKSSVLDAMVFALYGSVPRHDRRSVGSVVTQGCIQARVLLEFEVGGAVYTVARVVRKDARGRANTDEARLEREGSVVASGAREVDEAVAELLGLDYEQFTTCVVLPQGEFQRFLHAKPADRQGLLVALLDLGLYERIAQLATGRHRYEDGRRSAIEAQLAAVPGGGEDARAAAVGRIDELTSLLSDIDRLQPELDDLESRGRSARRLADEARDQRRRVASIELPDGFDELAGRLDLARLGHAEAGEQLESARSELARAEEEAAAGPPSASIRAQIERQERLAELGSRHAEAERRAEESARELAAAGDRHLRAVTALDAGRRHDMALHLRRGLEAGSPCPVCTRPVDEPVEEGDHAALDALEKTLEEAAAELDRVRAAATRAAATRDEIARQLAAAVEVGEGEVAVAGLREELVAAELREQVLATARLRHDEARRGLDEAVASLVRLGDLEKGARTALQRTRDSVAFLEPPPLELEDVAGDWKQLVEWASMVLPDLERRAGDLDRECERLRAAFGDLETALRARAEAAGVVAGPGRVRDAVVEARSEATARLAAADERAAQAAALRAELAGAGERAEVARELASHLRANNFERWMLDEAVRVLAIGANGRLAELAEGRYSLALSSRLEFEIVDHHAADEHRPVRSLSGGETFLVSLSLALSLADHIAEMAGGGGARLESIFLDEGFGTLDPETLETVAGVIAEIGTGGKTVGIVTHVADLAEQAPVRFEVVKDAGGARVVRVDP